MAAMDKLTPAQRAVMELHGVEGGTFEQVARYRRCSTKTVKELYRRATRTLRRELERYSAE